MRFKNTCFSPRDLGIAFDFYIIAGVDDAWLRNLELQPCSSCILRNNIVVNKSYFYRYLVFFNWKYLLLTLVLCRVIFVGSYNIDVQSLI